MPANISRILALALALLLTAAVPVRASGTTTLVKDINPGTGDSSPYGFTALGGYLYFQADDGTNGYELWRTGDGLPETNRGGSTLLPALVVFTGLLAVAGTLLRRRERRAH